MSERTSYAHGTPSWADLVAHDMDAAMQWYGDLFGWSAHEQDTGGGPRYAMFYLNGKPVAGIGQMGEEMKGQDAPPLWNTYIAVDDAAAVEARVKELGGSVTVPTMPVLDAGIMAFHRDPKGANFGVWQAVNHHGAGLVNEPGAMCWNELATKDIAAAKDFYGQLFGWTCATTQMGPTKYTEVRVAGDMVAGMLPMNEEWGDTPPHWMTYFCVADVDATAKKIAETGGTVCVPPTDIPPGRFAVVSDPQGGTFSVITLAPTK